MAYINNTNICTYKGDMVTSNRTSGGRHTLLCVMHTIIIMFHSLLCVMHTICFTHVLSGSGGNKDLLKKHVLF